MTWKAKNRPNFKKFWMFTQVQGDPKIPRQNFFLNITKRKWIWKMSTLAFQARLGKDRLG